MTKETAKRINNQLYEIREERNVEEKSIKKAMMLNFIDGYITAKLEEKEINYNK